MVRYEYGHSCPANKVRTEMALWTQLDNKLEFECLQVLELNKKYALSAALCSMPESNLVLLAVGLTDSKIVLFALNEETKQVRLDLCL